MTNIAFGTNITGTAFGPLNNPKIVSELHVSSILGDDSRWSNQKDIVGLIMAKEVSGTICPKDARMTNVAFGSNVTGTAFGPLNNPKIVSKLHVSSILGDDSRWSNQKDIVSLIVAEEVGGAICPKDARMTNVAFGRNVTGTAFGPLNNPKIVSKLHVSAILGDDTRWSNQKDIVGLIVAEKVGGAICPKDARMTNVAFGTNVTSTAFGSWNKIEIIGELNIFAIFCHYSRGSNQKDIVCLSRCELDVFSIGSNNT